MTPFQQPAPAPSPIPHGGGSSVGGSNMYPPGFGPPVAPASQTASPQPPRESKENKPDHSQPNAASPNAPTTPSLDRYPPGYTPPVGGTVPASASAVPASPASPAPSPPGYPPSAPSTPAAASPPTPPVPSSPRVAPIPSLPAAGTAAPTPPQGSGAESVGPVMPVSRRPSIEEMLPPGAGASSTKPSQSGVSDARVPETAAKTPRPQPVDAASRPKLPDTVVTLPTADGGFISIDDSVKVVEFEGERVEVRRLTPEEKQRRRLFKTVFMAIFGVLFLTVVALVLMMFL